MKEINKFVFQLFGQCQELLYLSMSYCVSYIVVCMLHQRNNIKETFIFQMMCGSHGNK